MMTILHSACDKTKEPINFGHKFWDFFAQADISEMENYFSTKIFIPRGSVLLDKKWGLNPSGDLMTGITIDRKNLLNGYNAILNKIGIQKWKTIFSSVNTDKITFKKVDTNNHNYYIGAKRNDIIMMVPTGKGDDRLAFVLSLNPENRWNINMASIIIASTAYY